MEEKVILFRYLIEQLIKDGYLEKDFKINDAVDNFRAEKADYNIDIVETINENHFKVLSGKYRTIEGMYSIDEGGHVVTVVPETTKKDEKPTEER